MSLCFKASCKDFIKHNNTYKDNVNSCKITKQNYHQFIITASNKNTITTICHFQIGRVFLSTKLNKYTSYTVELLFNKFRNSPEKILNGEISLNEIYSNIFFFKHRKLYISLFKLLHFRNFYIFLFFQCILIFIK